MSESQKNPGIALILSSLFGPFGADKFYIGATTLGLFQLITTLTVIFSPISIFWSTLSTVTLLLYILFGSGTFLYPEVNWAPTTNTDRAFAWILVGLTILSYMITVYVRYVNKNVVIDDPDLVLSYP